MAAVPLAVVVNLAFLSDLHVSSTGLLVAAVSGAVTSGLGYAIWFRALKTLSATVAGTVQLAVPVIAAAGGVWFLSEAVTIRLVIASIVVLAGIALTLPISTSWRIRWRDVVARVTSSRAET